ncbi:MAG: asparaginase, partial [Deltaproteobacteria bacterium]|nr:asparaginase [Deltaproteobacteria bacterium]
MSSENYNTGAPGALNSWPRSAPALEVEVLRGTVVESRHRVRACIIDREGRLRAAWGDVDAPMLPRSATKPLLACVLAESGALDKQQLTDRELALACASHNGEQEHVRAVRSWLENLGLGEADLACGAHPPFHVPSAAELISRGETPGALHNNCSGKHTGFLSAAVSLGLPIKGYMEPWHPLQMAAAEVLGELTGCAIAGVPEAVDGCGFPQWAISLRGLAAAVARLSDP